MFEQAEAKECPVCGMSLVAFDKLPPSIHGESEDGVPVEPAREVLPWTYSARGRGVLPLFAVVGLVLFMLPWVHITVPDDYRYSGFDLARKLGWSWGAAVSWVVLVPTVLSRRTIVQLRGARVAAAFLAAVPLVTTLILYLRPPHGGIVPLHFLYDPAFWITMALSVVAFAFALRLGGPVDDIAVKRGTSAGQTLN
ncbi:hypothetical protein BH09MYX1_BH09MYX1_45070 [soil metagenome]